MVRIGNDELLWIEIAERRLDDAVGNIVAAGKIDHRTEIDWPESAAAIVFAGNAGRTFDEDVRALQVLDAC
ncbi:hypothetical protein D3C78_1719900 [compost metagenome]